MRKAAEGSVAPPVWRPRHEPLIGASPGFQHLRAQIDRLARYDCSVLIQGETGSGKEIVAHHIHAGSPRSAGPFVPLDCTTLHESLVESQLFGHEQGSFTGAERSTIGLFRAADGGTLFLDEIGELKPVLQAKLLRCIQDSAIVPLGGHQPVPVDVRVLAATHRGLEELAATGGFRPDLLYRLDVVRVCIPPLRHRRCDIPLLVEHFLGLLADLYEEPRRNIAPEVLDVLCRFDWPGNVRQLRNAIEHAHVFAAGATLRPNDLPPWLRTAAATGAATDPPGDDEPVEPLEVVERRMIVRALRSSRGNQSWAARLLRVHRHCLRRKIDRFGLEHLL